MSKLKFLRSILFRFFKHYCSKNLRHEYEIKSQKRKLIYKNKFNFHRDWCNNFIIRIIIERVQRIEGKSAHGFRCADKGRQATLRLAGGFKLENESWNSVGEGKFRHCQIFWRVLISRGFSRQTFRRIRARRFDERRGNPAFSGHLRGPLEKFQSDAWKPA